MVQNQMTPSYPQFPQTSIEDYQQAATAATVATTAAVTDPTAQQPYKDGQAYVQAPVTQNGVEQQTVSVRAHLIYIVNTPQKYRKTRKTTSSYIQIRQSDATQLMLWPLLLPSLSQCYFIAVVVAIIITIQFPRTVLL